MSNRPPNLNNPSLLQPAKPRMEMWVALGGTAFAAFLLVLMAMHAGPLWRDEVNALNLAQMPSLREFWQNLPFESFPPLWPLVLRGWSALGWADTDAGVRILGLLVGMFFLASLWLCSRWMGCRAPILSLALLGSLPAFIFIIGANRAYGLGSCLVVLSFGTLWRVVELPSRSRIFWATVTCVLYIQCVYYDAVFLCAMLFGAAIVVTRRRQWKTLAFLTSIGGVAGMSMVIYLPIIHRGSAYVPVNQEPFSNYSVLWHTFCDSLATRSSAHPPTSDSLEIWLWDVLLSGGLVVALVMQRKSDREKRRPEISEVNSIRVRCDLTLFCAVSMLSGIVGFMAFLLTLNFPTRTWYYIEMLCLCAVALDGLLGASWPALRPWGWLRIGFMLVMMTWYARSGWEEAHARRSNVDQIALVLNQRVVAGDLIVVQSAWEGVTFDRYYHGPAHWVTVPPIDSHKVHRYDLVIEKMNQPDPMFPVLSEITNTLHSGNCVWIVGNMAVEHPRQQPLPPVAQNVRMVPHVNYWSAQVMLLLGAHAVQERVLTIPVNGPVSHLENLPLAQFSGFKTDAQ